MEYWSNGFKEKTMQGFCLWQLDCWCGKPLYWRRKNGASVNMRIPSEVKDCQRIILYPGDYAVVCREERVLYTILGSCISACLYDPVNRVAGMNHFLLSHDRYSRTIPFTEADAGRYGIHSMELLINAMMKQGADRRKFQAKAFGGASMLAQETAQQGNFMCVGEVNVRFIQEFLRTEGIPLVGSDLGGEHGRAVFFSSIDFSVHIRRLRNVMIAKINDAEREYWRREIEKQRDVKPDSRVELWD
jgi:chemotaxis protein CheD